MKGSLARAEKRLLNPEVQARAEQYKQSFNVKSLQRGHVMPLSATLAMMPPRGCDANLHGHVQ